MERGTHVKRLVVLAGVAVTTVLATTACGSGGLTTGFPTAAPTTTTQSTDSAGSTMSSGSDAGQSSYASKPCSMLSASDLTQIESTSTPYQDKTGEIQTCEINTSTFGVTLGVKRFSISLVPANGGTMVDVPINGRHGKEVLGALGGNGCDVLIPVTANSFVDLSVEMNDANATAQQTCGPAMQVAQLVERHLPPES
jgi:uncharacterized protein DUF3558